MQPGPVSTVPAEWFGPRLGSDFGIEIGWLDANYDDFSIVKNRLVLAGMMSPKGNPGSRPELLSVEVEALHRSSDIGEANPLAVAHR